MSVYGSYLLRILDTHLRYLCFCNIPKSALIISMSATNLELLPDLVYQMQFPQTSNFPRLEASIAAKVEDLGIVTANTPHYMEGAREKNSS